MKTTIALWPLAGTHLSNPLIFLGVKATKKDPRGPFTPIDFPEPEIRVVQVGTNFEENLVIAISDVELVVTFPVKKLLGVELDHTRAPFETELRTTLRTFPAEEVLINIPSLFPASFFP